MTDIPEIPVNDIRAVKRLRTYYRKNFMNGASDESFIEWIRVVLTAMRSLDSSVPPVGNSR